MLPWVTGPSPDVVLVRDLDGREVCRVTSDDVLAAAAERGPAVRDLHPLPETPEAKARGCRCTIVMDADGSPHVDRYGGLLYGIDRGCSIHA
jgi:hypothetical protein